MAPSPEDDNTPKAPDKNDKVKSEKSNLLDNPKEKDKDEKTLSNLNDGELKALLDEAITYKNPKDREGKSKLFKDLLIQAEESERIARAASAGGSELVRHCNPSARRNGRHRRKPSSISENMMHGGSLDNLAKEELFESTHHLHRTRKTVSARQREGGSLPCDVNSSVLPTRDYHFIEEVRRNKPVTTCKEKKEYTAIDMESESLLEHDSLSQRYPEVSHREIMSAKPMTAKFTTSATFQIFPPIPSHGLGMKQKSGTVHEYQSLESAGGNVDDPLTLDLDGGPDKKPYDVLSLQKKVAPSNYTLYSTPCKKDPEDKRIDENGNALHQSQGAKTKKKKVQTDKNVVLKTGADFDGHQKEIIHDVDKLMQFIGVDKNTKAKSNVHKSKQLHKQHASEDSGRSKKQRAHSTKDKNVRPELKKSNSLGEISTTKLDEFAFTSGSEKDEESKVVLRPNKGQNDRPKERRSWGNIEPPTFQNLYSNASSENLETTGNWVVTKPKKKSKKRRNSISSGRRQNSTSETNAAKQHANRAPSPDLRGKSACSVPQSEKSNDSSDVDSVHSLPTDGLNMPVSYADIAKNSEKLKEKKLSPEKAEKVPNKEKSPTVKAEVEPKPKVKVIQTVTNLFVEKHIVVTPVINNVKNVPPPDVHNIKSFPAIPNNNNKNLQVTATEKTNVKNNTVSNKIKNNLPSNKNFNKDNNVKVNVTLPNAVSVINDIQNDLSIIHSNEKDSIQFNAQMLPPDIPDVQTIEKMHFLNRAPPPITPHQTSPISSHSSPPSPQVPQVTPPSQVARPLPPSVPQAHVNVATNNLCINNVNCDSSERTVIEDDEGPPPVVILSGNGNKEVPGLVFGFDVNEQLLNEDICENFISRYVPPETYTHTSHNHDKIVNFIGSAWEVIVNETNGTVQYFSEDL